MISIAIVASIEPQQHKSQKVSLAVSGDLTCYFEDRDNSDDRMLQHT